MPRKVKVSLIMHFSAEEKLQCPQCGLTSKKHKVHSPRYERYLKDGTDYFVFLHTCKRCGYTDDQGDGFLDEANDDTPDFREIPHLQKSIYELENEIETLRFRLQKSEAKYKRRWVSDEDEG